MRKEGGMEEGRRERETRDSEREKTETGSGETVIKSCSSFGQ